MHASKTNSAGPTPPPNHLTPSQPRRRNWFAWTFSGMGLVSLVWFLVRVIPKPSRAAYPCQRVAFPIASSFVLWVMALLGSALAWRKARKRNQRLWQAFVWTACACAGCALLVASPPSLRAWAGNPPHGPLGIAKGVFPGRVAWVYAPRCHQLGRLYLGRALV